MKVIMYEKQVIKCHRIVEVPDEFDIDEDVEALWEYFDGEDWQEESLYVEESAVARYTGRKKTNIALCMDDLE